MPYKQVGKCVFKKSGERWVKKGCSSSVGGAKKYLAVLNMREKGVPPENKKQEK